MDGAREIHLGKGFRMREAERDEALHVARAATMPPAVAVGELPRTCSPGLAVDGHDIGMA